MKKPEAIVIGAGIGGLVAALELLNKGLTVSVLESAEKPGGKMRQLNVQGQPIDSGPTVFTMRWIFEEIFSNAGSHICEHLQTRPVTLIARHAWSDGSQLDLFADLDQSAEAIAAMAGRKEADRYLSFCARSKRIFDSLYGPFTRSQRPTLSSLIRASGWSGIVNLFRIQPFQSLWRSLNSSFSDRRLQSLFARYATYCGSNPLQAPATLMLIAHTEQCGVWQLEGGMQSLADALAGLIGRQGGEIRYGKRVVDLTLDRGRVSGVKLADGKHLSADVVIANTDVASIQAGQLGSAAAAAMPGRRPSERSLSAVTWSALANTSGFDLAHHNVFFPDDYPQEFDDIFKHGRLPARPAVYVCAQDRGHAMTYEEKQERLFIIVNAPANGDRENYEHTKTEELESRMLNLLGQCGLHIDEGTWSRIITTPADFEQRFPGTGGALYGMPSHGWRSSFSRSGARSRMHGLFLAGGSVHPGAGVPMVALSGQLAAVAAARELGLN